MITTLALAWTLVATAGGGCPQGMAAAPGGPGLAAFCLDLHEVSVAEYAACVTAGACTPAHDTVDVPRITPADRDLWSRACAARDPVRLAQHPINCVDHDQAAAYCAWRGARLPVEAEWTWAAQGGDHGRMFPWGDQQPGPGRVNACGAECKDRFTGLGRRWETMYDSSDGHATTAPVASMKRGRGRFGHHHLAGNVWEHVDGSFDDQPGVGVIRGGGWTQTDARWLRSSSRAGYLPASRGSAVGFRCAGDLTPARSQGKRE